MIRTKILIGILFIALLSCYDPPKSWDVSGLNIEAVMLVDFTYATSRFLPEEHEVPEDQPVPEPEPEPERPNRPSSYSIAQAVADCESGDIKANGRAIPYTSRATAENPTSGASGAWQFMDSTWTSTTGLAPPAKAYPLSVQEEAFWKLWNNGNGARHWRPSVHCWGPLWYN